MNRKLIVGAILCVVVCFIGYIIYKGKAPSFDGVFTQYNALPYDSIYVDKDSLPSLQKDTLLNDSDSLGISNSSLHTPLNSPTDTIIEKEKESIFHVNTSYDKILDTRLSEEKLNMVTQHQADSELFAELLLPEKEKLVEIEKAFNNNTIPYGSKLRLLTIAGQDILLKENNTLSQMIIDALADANTIGVIHVLDRKNNIVYSSHKTLANSTLLASLNDLDFESKSIELITVDGHTWISIPIYYTYGKIGHVLSHISQ
ncbi:MAG: hypothetical protein P1U56_24250 [Saprospiraceae bacterium]|nr:hypothetical protein [Saprospiraceae bacterium]